MAKHLYPASYVLCLAVMLLATWFLLAHPGVFPAGGYDGPAFWREATPAGIRFSGDSYRYLSGAERVLAGESLSPEQAPYRGYIWVVAVCLRIGLGLPGLVGLQVAFAGLALLALMAAARRAAGSGLAAVTGAIFALNPDFPVWHTFVMTESLYISAVCLTLWLALWAGAPGRPWRYGVVLAAVMFFAQLRPSGWIMLPAVALFWLGLARWPGAWRLAGAAAVVVLFLALAFGGRGFRQGISGQSPVDKLYSGEVVWQEDLWRVAMPPPPGSDRTYLGAVTYILRHPVACCHLALRRLAVLFLRVRPGYSAGHNAVLLAVYLPLALLGAVGAWLGRRRPEVRLAVTLVLAHALVVALTFNDNDGRFSLYLTPPLGLLAAMALVRLAGLVSSRHRPSGSAAGCRSTPGAAV
ncbi:MAG: hypothetical protein PHC30_07385 [Lentisphaeria bacterium]|jgi:hypothetical protein|nr:hypothetical protein [Lentisphaeria bacterium]